MSKRLDNPSTFKDRDAWIRALLAAKMPDAAARLAIAIAMDLNVKSGRCDPSYARQSKASGIPERTAYRLVALLEQMGWIAVQRTRGRLRNQYFLVLNPANKVAGLNPAKSCQRENSTLPNQPSNPANMVAVNKRRQAKKERKKEARLRAPPKKAHARFPEGWQPADLTPDQHADFDHFADHARTCARTCADWDAAWRNWQRKSRHMQQQERPNGRSLLAAFDRAIDRDAAAAYVPGSEGPQPITLDSRPRPAGIRSLPKG